MKKIFPKKHKTGRHAELGSASEQTAQIAKELSQEGNNNLNANNLSTYSQDIQIPKQVRNDDSCLVSTVGWTYLPNITKLAQTAALSLALSFFIAAPAMAQAPVPTLDNLHNQEIINPATQDRTGQSNRRHRHGLPRVCLYLN